MNRLTKLIIIDLSILMTVIVAALLADIFFKSMLSLILFLISVFGLTAFVCLTTYIVVEEIIKKEG